MCDADCRLWAEDHSDSGIINVPTNQSMGLSSKVLRFLWNGRPSVSVCTSVSSGERINLILSGLAWLLQENALSSGLNAIICSDAATGEPPWVELDAISTQAAELAGVVEVQLFLLHPGGEPEPIAVGSFDPSPDPRPSQWSDMLLAASLAHLVDHPSLALYPKLGTGSSSTPWQIRLDGLEVGRIGLNRGRLKLATSNFANPGEPRDTWRAVVGSESFEFTRSTFNGAINLLRELIAAWGGHARPGAVLSHGRPEHALEAHILSGRLQLITSDDGPLFPIAPIRDGAIGGAQFPTIWGTDGKARYLDALLKDEQARPWAIELKDQHAGGGHGSYLRHGISQAVLYRHFIRVTSALDPWFHHLGLVRSDCQAAVAFPAAAPVARARVEQHRLLAQLFDVDVIEFNCP